MNEYRNSARQVARDSQWTVFRFLPVTILVIVIFTVIGFGTRWLGLWGGTVVERVVFEESYQRSEALKSQIATDEAALTEISMQLSNPNLDENTRFNLEAQAAAARVRIATAKGKQ